VINVLWISTSMFLSVILAAVIYAVLGIYAATVLDFLLDVGDVVADWIYDLEFISTKVTNVLRFLISGPQMVFLFFVITSRAMFALVGMAFQRD
jgi:hypothetical protein